MKKRTYPFINLSLSPSRGRRIECRPSLVNDKSKFSKETISYLVRFLDIIRHWTPQGGLCVSVCERGEGRGIKLVATLG